MPAYTFTRLVQRDQLECLEIHHPFFDAELLLQGGQLIHFKPHDSAESWVWLSDEAEYTATKSLRGGIPVCWPWFGDADKNPAAVCQHIPQSEKAAAHGFVRNEVWQLERVVETCHQVTVTLSFTAEDRADWQGKARLTAEFIFTANQCELSLCTTNLDSTALNFSQALHTYLPTADITQSRIYGLTSARFANALITDNGQWRESRQSGAVGFSAETDRVYFPLTQRLQLQTPKHHTLLLSQGSHSCVVWNPWINKSKRLSQFNDQAYQHMLCIETANVMTDSISLAPGEQHTLTVNIRRS